ncbi:MAG: preprotein translocase subunit YajC [Bryobacteraceae bacterium]
MTFALLLLQADLFSQASAYFGVLQLVLILGIFYFLLLMPMQRQKKAQKDMLAGLQSGNVVQTSGGIIGTVLTLDSDTLVIRIKPDNVKIQVARSAVAGVVSEKS